MVQLLDMLYKNSLGTKLWLPIIIGVIALIAFCLWQYFNWKTEAFQAKHEHIKVKDIHKIKKDLTKWTIRNVTSEAIFLFCGALSTSLWMIEYDQNCAAGCRGPETPQCKICNDNWVICVNN